MKRSLAAAAVLALALPGAALAAKKPKRLDRPRDPVVLTGAQLPRLLGIPPGELVAYRYRAGGRCRSRGCRPGKLVRIPVQVDERAKVDFGSQPPSNGTPPSGAATVYGTNPIGVTALQYTDPGTFVGPDPDPSLDADDEIALMAADSGARARAGVRLPKRVRRGGATALTVTDPLTGGRGYVYLFRARPTLGGATADYVDYGFRLLSGDYKPTYKRRDGPNPEASTVTTAEYRAGYSDRWFLDTLAVDAGAAGGEDILDGFKTGFAPGFCARSEATYNDAEGAFVANRDGPVRAIRSYVGANSGPLTQRTDVFYEGRLDTRIDLRVHAISSILAYVDLSAAAVGMSYRNPAAPGGVPVDGALDALGAAPAPWSLWSGPQGSLFSSTRLTTSFDPGSTTGFYRDELATGIAQCWGDANLIGAAGTQVTPAGGIPNTDPRSSPFATFVAEVTNLMTAPGAGAADAAEWHRRLGAPLTASAKKFKPRRKRR